MWFQESSLQLKVSQSLLFSSAFCFVFFFPKQDSQLLLFPLAKRGPSESSQFQGLPKAIFQLFTFLFKELSLQDRMFDLGGNLQNLYT